MSQANASARARRAFNPPSTPTTQPPTNTSSGVNSSGLTLPQVISIIDNRLIKLETFMRETKEINSNEENVLANTLSNTNISNDTIDEFNHRFNILVDEIGNIKDIVLKLQSYTMEVNKTLYQERIQVFSDLGEQSEALTREIEITDSEE